MKHTPEEIKNRLSNIGEAIGKIALDYIVELEKENAGLKAGRPQWHDLRKDKNDLPKEQKEYWCKVFLYESEETFNAFLWYDLKTKSFMFEEDIEEGLSDPFNVKEWCEIPTFDKE